MGTIDNDPDRQAVGIVVWRSVAFDSREHAVDEPIMFCQRPELKELRELGSISDANPEKFPLASLRD
jgi:hypothetical protein